MTGPDGSHRSLADADAQDRWRDIVDQRSHTPQTWACIAAAIRSADDALAELAASDAIGASPQRAGALWCRIAAGSYHLLVDTGAYAGVDAQTLPACAVNETAARIWLTAPVGAPGRDVVTVAQRLDIDDDFLEDDEDRPARLRRLIHAAQQAGVFGASDADIELWHIADDQLDLDGHRLAARLSTGVVLASPLLAIDDLVDDGLTGLDAAIDVLVQASRIITEVVTTAAHADVEPTATAPPILTPEPIPSWVDGYRIGPGRAFPPPTHGQPTPSTADGPPAAQSRMGRPPQPHR